MENTFQNGGITRRLWRFQSIEVGFFLILSIYKVVYVSIKDLCARYMATCWEKLAVKFATDLDWSKSHE